MSQKKDCKDKEISEVLQLLNLRQNLVKEQTAVNNECSQIELKIKKMRNHYGLKLEHLRKILEKCDRCALGELRCLFNEFQEEFQKQYQQLLKLRRKSESIQDEIFKTVEKIQKLCGK